ncbi:MAG: tRNA pseudouridine(38-40) synthase TruA, partial [Clostridia bacterium]|nr:tRNA pseudouridine(38-40) synthase TruA [Clostridia bacterium]
KAVYKFSGENIKLTGCGRTDAKVHALNYYANFSFDKDFELSTIKNALNHFLPSDIRIKDVFEKETDFHSRFSAKSKEYMYLIDNGETEDPFLIDRAFHYDKKIDLALIEKACKEFEGTHDFKAFMASGSSVKDTVRTIYSCRVERKDNKVYLYFKGNGFLYNMVRIMAGTLIFVNENKIKVSDIKDIIDKKDRANAGITLPGWGLYLKDVEY